MPISSKRRLGGFWDSRCTPDNTGGAFPASGAGDLCSCLLPAPPPLWSPIPRTHTFSLLCPRGCSLEAKATLQTHDLTYVLFKISVNSLPKFKIGKFHITTWVSSPSSLFSDGSNWLELWMECGGSVCPPASAVTSPLTPQDHEGPLLAFLGLVHWTHLGALKS